MPFSSGYMLSVQFAGGFNAYVDIRFTIFVFVLMGKITFQTHYLDDWLVSAEADP